MKILKLWQKCNQWPFGKQIFSFFLGRIVPYTGSTCPLVTRLESGHAEIFLKDRRRVRNHLNSIHAIALINISEAVTGLAVLAAVPDGFRAIITKLEIEYLKKARGNLLASCEFPPRTFQDGEVFTLESVVKNSSNEVVCRTKAHWKVGK